MKRKEVALVLAGGGARGIAHISAIEELERRGYHIHSVAGTSMGALVGGIYAGGGLAALRKRLTELDKMEMLSLMDFTISNDGVVKGNRIMRELQQTVLPDINIEELPIPFCAVATDIRHRREVVFERGGLYEAIRSSISIPSLFQAYRMRDMLLIDGGVFNPIPLNRVIRKRGDLLVAVDVTAPAEQLPVKRKMTPKETHEPKLITKLKESELYCRIEAVEKLRDSRRTMGYYDILTQSINIMTQRIAALSIEINKPDIIVRVPSNAFGVLDFTRADEILEFGRQRMVAALDTFEKR